MLTKTIFFRPGRPSGEAGACGARIEFLVPDHAEGDDCDLVASSDRLSADDAASFPRTVLGLYVLDSQRPGLRAWVLDTEENRASLMALGASLYLWARKPRPASTPVDGDGRVSPLDARRIRLSYVQLDPGRFSGMTPRELAAEGWQVCGVRGGDPGEIVVFNDDHMATLPASCVAAR